MQTQRHTLAQYTSVLGDEQVEGQSKKWLCLTFGEGPQKERDSKRSTNNTFRQAEYKQKEMNASHLSTNVG